MRSAILFVVLILIVVPNRVAAQETSEADSLKSYDLSEIVIGGETRQSDQAERVFRVDLATIARQDVPDVASTLRLLPSANVQTNSRGETLVYIRAAGERQVAVFLDGAPLNVAWDNRIDLSLVPANVIGGMSVERGAVGPGYGTNTSGGALSLQSRRLDADGTLSELTVQAGSAGARQIRGLFASRNNGTGILFGGTLASSDGMVVPRGTTLPFEPDEDLRINTDREESNAYLRIDRELTKGRIGLTVMHARAEKGVAPEGHLDPSLDRVRYWRYPLWRHSMAILNGIRETEGVRLSGSAWLTHFRQDVTNYTDVTYHTADEEQEDTDLAAGFRLIADGEVAAWKWRLISVVSASEHRQVDSDLLIPDQSAPEVRYQNVLHTLGGEVTSSEGYPGHWAVGVAWDGMKTPETGAFPSTGGYDAYSLNAEWHRNMGSTGTLMVNGGSKPRFPTMRELFGTALDRFVINEDLRPERTWMIEGGWEERRERWQSTFTAFAQRTMDTIDQENVIVDGERKRQRVNLDGSRVLGVEWISSVRPAAKVQVQGHVTWLRPVALTEDGNRHLTEKPEVLATIQTRLEPTRSISVDVMAVYTGAAYGMAPTNELVSLPTAWQFNARVAAQRFFVSSGLFLQAYAGVDNLTDARLEAQLGLPSAGRTARVGLSLSR